MFKEKFYSDIRKKLYEIMAITFERYLSLVRMDEKEFDQKLDEYIEESGIEYARWRIYIQINSISCVLQERSMDRHMTEEEQIEHAKEYGLCYQSYLFALIE